MMAPGHSIISISGTLAAVVALNVNLPAAAVIVGASSLTSSLPDADLTIPWLPHRGPLSHSPWIVAMFTITAIITLAFTAAFALHAGPTYPFYLGVGLGAGALFHVIADSLTPGGTPLLYPFTSQDYRLLPHRLCMKATGDVAEAFGYLCALAVTYLIWKTYIDWYPWETT